MAIRRRAAISPRNIFTVLSLLCLKTVSVQAQQCLTGGGSQQSLQKTSCNLNQANSGHNFNAQHASIQQMNYQQPSNIQQASFMQQTGSVQPQWSLQQVSQPPINSMSNSQPSQQNQNYGTHTYSASQSSRSTQGSNTAQSNVPQQASSQPMTSTFIPAPGPTNKPQYGNQAVTVEASQFQPTSFSFQPVQSKSSSNNGFLPQNQENNVPSNLNSYTNSQNIEYSQNQPTSNSVTNQRATSLQSPIAVLVPSSQSNTAQPQPIILALQTPQMLPIQSPCGLSTLPASQFGVNQPIVYAVQTPSLTSNQNQQIVPKQASRSNNVRSDDQTLMTYLMSQMGNDNPLASILPSIINTKSDKSSFKALLPLLFNILNERNSGCVCPHCGCNNNNSQRSPEPVINSGYSNKKVYSSQEPCEDLVKNIESNDINSSNVTERDSHKNNDVINDDHIEASDEEDDDEEEDSEEDDEEE